MSGHSNTTMTTPEWIAEESDTPVLWMLHGPTDRRLVSPPRSRLFLGRNPSSKPAFAFDDERMSRTHARIEWLPIGVHALYDNQSKNGTWHNGAPATGNSLRIGDVVRIGETVMVVGRAIGSADGGKSPLLGRSQPMREARQLIRRFAKSELTMLLLGESGTGKEVTAEWAHQLSGRKGRFVAVNCASIPAQLVERELFGHVKGAYTSADRGAAGYIDAARGGTLFLDEIGELPLEVQPKLLRFVEERRYSPLGSTQSKQADVRILAATNRDLTQMIAEERFREDLFARLDEGTVRLPPLRERKEDLVLLMAGLLKRESAGPLTSTADFVEALALHDWPRNVRELSKLLKRLSVLNDENRPLDWGDLPDKLQKPIRLRYSKQAGKSSADAPSKAELEQLLTRFDGNVSKVAQKLGRSRKLLYSWFKSHGIEPRNFRS